jgi:hypothetical protein
MVSRHIAILVHEYDRFDQDGYLMAELAEIWRSEGYRTTVVQGPRGPIEADVVVLHIDMTVIPDDYLKLIEHCPRVLNRQVIDISKRRFSRQQVVRGDGYVGPVIVKTNRNCGGGRERLAAARGSWWVKYRRAVRERLPWSWRSHLPTTDYHIFPSPKQVPRAVWHNPDLLVERFLSERHDGFYCLRTWVFLGDRETNSLSYSHEPIIKSQSVVRREPVSEVPEELRQIRKE